MKKSTNLWLKGLIAALVSGAGQGLATGMTAIVIAPGIFNIESGLKDTLTLVGISVLTNVGTTVGAYFKRSPLPDENGNGLELPPKS